MNRLLVIALSCVIGIMVYLGKGTLAAAETTTEYKQGMSSPIIMQLQLKLREQGFYYGNPTEYFGQDVQTAVIYYQAYNYLNVTGTLNEQTAYAMFGKSLSQLNSQYNNVQTIATNPVISKPVTPPSPVIAKPVTPAVVKPVYSTYTKKAKIIKIAKQYTGIPYRFGGTTTRGFDCSGYVGYVYNKVGTKLPRTAASMYQISSIVRKPVPGDLVFFRNTYKKGISHVGIFLGENKFISATSSKGVAIVSLSNSYWKSKYVGPGSVF